MKRTIGIAAATFAAATLAFAQDPAPAAAAEQNQAPEAGTPAPAASTEIDMVAEASKPAESNPEDDIDSRMTKWLDGMIWANGAWVNDPNKVNGKAIEEQMRKTGGMIVQGVGLIGADASDPNFGKLRTLAYEKALNQARSSYLLSKKQDILVDTYSHLEGGDDEVPKYKHDLPKSQQDEIIRKTLAVAGAKLDQELDALGVDKEKFSQASEAQRHVMMSEAVSRNAVIRSFGELSGLMPVQTFEGFRYVPELNKKVPCVGVICTVSQSSRQLAKDILSLRGDFPASDKKGFALAPYYRSIEDKLPDMFGVRRMKDENGYPVLVAFGQWSNAKKTGNATLMLRYGDMAAKQSDSWARTELALFLNSNFGFERPSEMGGVFEEAVNVFADDSTQEDNTQKVMDKISETLTGKSFVKISGVRVLHSWNRPHPAYPNVRLYGTVIAWSPAYEQQARNLDKPLSASRPSEAAAPAASAAPAKPVNAASRQSDMDMDIDDF